MSAKPEIVRGKQTDHLPQRQLTHMRKRGDILEASNRAYDAGRHYIVFYDGYDDTNFIGGMVTHMPSHKNAVMNQSHFYRTDSGGNNYKFQFDNSNLVIAKLMKFEAWGPFTKVGELTPEGINFVEITIGDLNSETWEEYRERTK